jgi:1-acyl-sn-glycerol-3-phosphate acyltransferase
MLRSMIILLLGVAITGYLSACAMIFGLISPGENKIHRIARIWARILLSLSSTRVEVIGAENVLVGKPQIFMANHQSDFDIFIVLGFIPGQFRWIAKKELFKIPLFGQAMRNAGYIEIDRHHHEKALKSLDLATVKIREGKSVMTFPEGTRSKDGTIKPFKQGMFHLAIKAGVPVVPVSIIGAGTIMPRRSLRINPGNVTMIIDKPIDVTGYSVENRAKLIERVRNVIVNNFDRGMPSKKVELSPAVKDLPALWEMWSAFFRQ